MWQQPAGIHKHGVPSGRFDNRHPGLLDLGTQVGYLFHPEVEVRQLQDFPKPHRQSFQVAPGQTAVSGETLDDNHQVGDTAIQLFIIEGDETADIGQPVLLGRHHDAVAEVKHFTGDFSNCFVAVSRLITPDEVTVFGKTSAIKKERDTVLPTQVRHLAVIGNRHDHQGDLLTALLPDELLQPDDVHVAFERQRLG